MIKLFYFIFLILSLISSKQLNIENIFPDRGPLSGGTRLLVFNAGLQKINIKKYPNPKVLLLLSL